MKRIISLLLVLAMLLPFCPALADTVYYTLDDFGQAIRRFDDAWADEYTLTVAEGALGSMSDSQLHSFIFRSGCFCLSFRISNIPVTKGGVPCREISIIPRYRPSKAILEAYRMGCGKYGEEAICRARFLGDGVADSMAGGLDKARRTGVTRPIPGEG